MKQHKNNCKYISCKSHRGETSGINNGNYFDGRHLKNYYCKTCGKKISITSGVYGKGRCNSCSQKGKKLSKNQIYLITQRMIKHHPTKKPIGTKRIDSYGYILIKLKDKWIPFHRYKIELYIGRKLKKTEIIHHIDGNTKNNNLKNLYIFNSPNTHHSVEVCINEGIINKYYIKSNLENYKLREKKQWQNLIK